MSKKLENLCRMYIDLIHNKNIDSFSSVIRYNGERMIIHKEIISELCRISKIKNIFQMREITHKITNNIPDDYRNLYKQLLDSIK